MTSLAELPEIVGFFSYSRDDDEAYKGSLSSLRQAIQHELGSQLGRSRTTFRLWQDREAIAPGTLWESEITGAVAQSVFFIPIVTPRSVSSHYCKFEFDAFLERESALGRADLIFPILYIPVPALADETQWSRFPVLSAISKRQFVDWQTFRYEDAPTRPMREAIANFSGKIVEALSRPWISAVERERQEREAQRRAEDQRRREEAEQKGRAEEEEQRRQQEREAQQRAEDQRRREEAEQKRRAEEEEQRKQQEREAQQRPDLPDAPAYANQRAGDELARRPAGLTHGFAEWDDQSPPLPLAPQTEPAPPRWLARTVLPQSGSSPEPRRTSVGPGFWLVVVLLTIVIVLAIAFHQILG